MFLRLIVITLIFVGCKKTETFKDFSEYTSSANAQFNSTINWTAKARYVISNDSFDLVLDVYNGQNYLRESLGFLKIPLKSGLYKLFESNNNSIKYQLSAYSTLTDDGDVACDYYNLDTAYNSNFIRIVELNKQTKQIKCEFSGKYFTKKLPIEKCNKNWPDTIVFKNGIVTGSY